MQRDHILDQQADITKTTERGWRKFMQLSKSQEGNFKLNLKAVKVTQYRGDTLMLFGAKL